MFETVSSREITMTDAKIAEYFSFLTQCGFAFERDYSKATDKSCTQIYRLKKDAGNYLEFRVLSEREHSVCVCRGGEKSFPNLGLRYKKFIRGWKRKRLFSRERRDGWCLAAALCRHVLDTEGNLFGIIV